MSLKQECFDMIKLITEPLKKNEYDFYDLEMDSIRDFCEKTGEDITYSDCYDCNNYGKDCPYKQYDVKVDVSFWDGADCQRNYVFGNKLAQSKGIRVIKNRKQLMDEMSKVKKEIETFKDWYAEFGEHYDEYLEYAREFTDEVKKEYLFFGVVQTEILPIIFHTDYNQCNGEIDYKTQGNLQIVEKQNVINVYCCMENIEETKRTIRHEVLHYMLYIAGLKYKDDTAIFHHLCEKFDANAYKDMGDEEQMLYDRLSNALSMIKAVFDEKDMPNETYMHNYIAMLLAIGCDEGNSLYKKLRESGEKVMKFLELEECSCITIPK